MSSWINNISLLQKLLCFLFIFLCLSCSHKSNEEKAFPDLKGQIIFKGHYLSGSHDLYWSYNIDKNKVSKLSNKSYISVLDLKHLALVKFNPDEQKVILHEKLIRGPLRKFLDPENESILMDLINSFSNNIREKMGKETIESYDLKYEIIPDYENNKINLINRVNKNELFLKFDDYSFGYIFNPESRYIAFFMRDSFIFRDGSPYKLCFINLQSSEVRCKPDLSISNPLSMVWLNNN